MSINHGDQNVDFKHNMKTLFVLIILLPFSSVLGQSGFDYENGGRVVIDSKGVILRSEPSVNAKKIKAIQFAETVHDYPSSNSYNFKDTINGMINTWLRVVHNNDTGYVFSPYISHSIQKKNVNFPSNNPQFFREKRICGDIFFFNPILNWYGLYPLGSENSYQFKKVSIDFNISQENFELNRRNELSPAYLGISTKESEKSFLLFGIDEVIPNHRIRIKPNPVTYKGGSSGHNSISPGENISMGYNKVKKESYTLECYGIVDEFSFNEDSIYYGRNIIRDYQVKVKIKGVDGDINYQNLNIKQRDTFQFIGDLNNDNILDLIINRHNSYAEATTYLLLSNYGPQLYTKVAENYFGSCY